jgi:uncharacterized protein
LPLWLGGFSFGGAATLAASEVLAAEGIDIAEMVLIAPGFARMPYWSEVKSGGAAPASTLLIHGELDETVPLSSSFAWSRGTVDGSATDASTERGIAVTVVPGAAHFFHQRLHILKRLVQRHLGVDVS